MQGIEITCSTDTDTQLHSQPNNSPTVLDLPQLTHIHIEQEMTIWEAFSDDHKHSLGLFHSLCPILQRHNTENSKQIFPGKELHGYSPHSYIHVSVSDLYVFLSSV
jgi:hypothetical protein